MTFNLAELSTAWITFNQAELFTHTFNLTRAYLNCLLDDF